MDNTMVSARVSAAKKKRAQGVLSSIGATTSDLINDALDYVIAMKQLPCAAGENRAQPSMADFRAFVEASTLSVQWPESADGDYKSLMQRERLSDYESLA